MRVQKWPEWDGVKGLLLECVMMEHRDRHNTNITAVLILGEKGGSQVSGMTVEQVLRELQDAAPVWHGPADLATWIRRMQYGRQVKELHRLPSIYVITR